MLSFLKSALVRVTQKVKAQALAVAAAAVMVVGLSFGVVEPALATDPAIDVTAATTLISGDVTTAIKNIGLALIALAAIVLGLRWIKASFF